MLRIFGFMTVAAAVALVSPVAAKSRKKHVEGTQVAREQVCRPLCNIDMTPCDPPEFKHADGRCDAGVHNAGGFR